MSGPRPVAPSVAPAGVSPAGASPGPLLRVKDLVKLFPLRRGFLRRPGAWIRAVDGVSFEIRRGETLSLVGESGSGKTTAGRLILRLLEPTSGEAYFDGEPLFSLPPPRLRRIRRQMQAIFQDPYGSLNPRMTIEDIVGEGLVNFGIGRGRERRARVDEALTRVGLDPRLHLRRYPHEFSGGQRQRIGIARALIVEPRFVVCDEPISSLDVSVQAQILNLLAKLQAEEGYAYLFIAHDLAVVRHLSDRVAVLYLGRLAEIGPAEAVCYAPHHPYTRALLASAPADHPLKRSSRTPLRGELPSPIEPPPGCRFQTRCPFVMDRCRVEEPPPVEVTPGHYSWCFLPASDLTPPGP